MKTVQLPTLKLEVQVKDNIHYRDDGIVPNLWEHQITLNRERIKGAKEYGYPKVELTPYSNVPLLQRTKLGRSIAKWNAKRKPILTIKGRCSSWAFGKGESTPTWEEAVKSGEGQLHIRTFVEQGLSPLNAIMIQGHEQTHALIRMGRLDALQLALYNIGKRGDLLSTMSLEAVCEVGGLYALNRKYNQDFRVNQVYLDGGGSSEIISWIAENDKVNNLCTSWQSVNDSFKNSKNI